MRLFNAKILEAHLEGDGSGEISSEAWMCLLARAETLKFTCVVDEVSNSPTLTLYLIGGLATGDDELTKTLVSTGLTGPTTITATYSSGDPNYPPPRHIGVEAVLAGAGGVAHVRVWACGRGPQLLEAIPATAATFSAQLAAARMLEDEDRLPPRKRVLKQGASLFYPPELLQPSLKWDR